MFRFEGLAIWQRSADILDDVYEMAEVAQKLHHYRFAEQLRAAILSVSNNIAEGTGSRSTREHKYFLNIAHRSVFETASMVIILQRRGIIDTRTSRATLSVLEILARQILKFSDSLDANAGRSAFSG